MTTRTEQTVQMMNPKELRTEFKPFFTNPRTETGLSKPEIKELADDIKANGLHTPLVVIEFRASEDAATQFLIIDGQRRKFAADLLELKLVPVIFATPDVVFLNEKSGAYWELYALRTVGHRKNLSSFEQAQAAAKSRAAGETNEKIGAALNRSPTWVSRMISAYQKAEPELLASWAKGEVTDEQVKDLATVEAPKQADAVQQTVSLRASGDRTSKAAARATAKAAAPVKPVPPPKPAAASPRATKSAAPASLAPAPKMYPPPPTKILTEIVSLRSKHRPTDAYTRGLTDGIAYAVGAVNGAKLEASFRGWLAKVNAAQAVAKAKAAKKPVKTKLPPKKKQVTLKKSERAVAAKKSHRKR